MNSAPSMTKTPHVWGEHQHVQTQKKCGLKLLTQSRTSL